MKKIGVSSSGTIIVEMTATQYDALAQSQTAQIEVVSGKQAQIPKMISKMATTEKIAYVRARIVKLKPKRKEGVVRSISAMFQFNGGIEDQEIRKIIGALQKEKLLTIDGNERVTFQQF